MSTAAVSSLSIFQELQSFYQSRRADLKQLGSALQSGDLNGAQQAYNTLAALGQSGPFANSEPFAKSSRAQAFDAIGQALQDGDLAGAQAAFATLIGNQNNSATSAQETPAAFVNLTGTQPSNTSATGNASSIYQQLQAYRQQRLADLAALGKALQSGDRAGAQSAFANLSATFGKQDQQSQTAISAYNSGVTGIITNRIPPPTSTGGLGTETTRFIGPPILEQPPTPPPSPIGPPVVQPPTQPPTADFLFAQRHALGVVVHYDNTK